jgi:hypothetical protein
MLSAPAARRGGACGHPLRPPYITRYYRPLELREVIGNVTIDDVRNKARCQKRGSCEWISAQLFHPTGDEARTIRFSAAGANPMREAGDLAR